MSEQILISQNYKDAAAEAEKAGSVSIPLEQRQSNIDTPSVPADIASAVDNFSPNSQSVETDTNKGFNLRNKLVGAAAVASVVAVLGLAGKSDQESTERYDAGHQAKVEHVQPK